MDFITEQGGLILTVIAVITGLNILLNGAHKFLEFIKDKTKTDWDNKAFVWVGNISGWLAKALEFLGNIQPKKKEIEKKQ